VKVDDRPEQPTAFHPKSAIGLESVGKTALDLFHPSAFLFGAFGINIKSLIAAASLVAQVVYFVGFGWMLVDMFSLVNVVTPEMEEDSRLLVPYIRETFDSYRPALGIGIIGAVVSYMIYLKSDFRASWYLNGTRILGWLWLPFIPIGTLIGAVLLGARKSAIESAAEKQQSPSM
jgi:hypothetical protein